MLTLRIVFVDDTIIEAPETPAPVFAVRAFKHALFGTPQPAPATEKPRQFGPRQKHPRSSSEHGDEKKPKSETSLSASPTKPQGILLTPGTATLRRKQVTFGEVVDNEGKKPIGRSGIPSNCPGKFPSPWTPKIVDFKSQGSEAEEERGLDSAKPAAESIPSKIKNDFGSIADGAASSENKTVLPSKPRAKDDVDLTTTMLDPKSPSGKYWKEQYLTYSTNSEGEVKKLIAKAKLAKDYAKKKDEEAIRLRHQLEAERRKRKSKKQELKKQVDSLQEQLRVVVAKNTKMLEELASLRQQLKTQGLEFEHQPVNEEREQQVPTFEPDSLWSEAATSDEEASYLPKSAKSRPAEFKRNRLSTERYEKPNKQLEDVRKPREPDGVRKRAQTTTPSLDFFKTALSPITGSPSSPLLARSPNIMASPRIQTKFSPEEAENRSSGELNHRNLESALDYFVPTETLSMQADRMTTPVSAQRERRQPRAKGKSPAIPPDRAAAAKERLAAKKKMKEDQRDRRLKMHTVI